MALGLVEAAAAAVATLKRILCSGFVVAVVLAPASLWSFPRSKMEEGSGPGGIRWCEGEGSSFLDPELDDLGGFRRPIRLHRLDPTRWSW